MVVHFFKNNNPASYILLSVLTVILWAPALYNHTEIDIQHGMPLYDIIAKPLSQLPFLASLTSVLLVITEAFILNLLVNKNEILPTPTFLPAFIYIIFMSSFREIMALHPILFSNLFILLSIDKMVNSYRKNIAFSDVFDSGILFSIACLFYLPNIFLLPIYGIGLQIFRPFIWREWVICLLGILFPYLFVFVYYFWYDSLEFFWYNKVVYSVLKEQIIPQHSVNNIMIITLGTTITVLSLISSFNTLTNTSQKMKKGNTLLMWLFIFFILAAFITTNNLYKYFWFIAIPTSVFASNFFLNLKKQLLGELLILSLLCFILVNHFFN